MKHEAQRMLRILFDASLLLRKSSRAQRMLRILFVTSLLKEARERET